MQPLYRLVYHGELMPGKPTPEIIRAFAERFRVQEDAARNLIMGGGRQVLKYDLDVERAGRYRSVIEQIGLVVDLECQNPEAETRSSAAPARGSVVAPMRAAPTDGGLRNPYAPPEADITPPRVGGAHETLHDPRSVAVGRGWGWVADAWSLFRVHPWAWIGALLLFGLICLGLGVIPVVGGLVVTILGPMFTGGLMIGAHAEHGGGRFEITHLFAGFQRNPGRLAALGATYLGAALVLGSVIGAGLVLIVGVLGAGIGPEGFDPSDMTPEAAEQLGPLLLLPVLVGLLLGVPLMMAVLFAPALVALNDVPAMRAFKLSFLGCWRNMLPFLLYGLVGFALTIASILTLGLSLLLVMPLMTIAIYIAYRDIYYR